MRDLRHRFRMSTTTDSRRVDEAMHAYVDWLELSIAVQDAYDRWTDGVRCEAAASFAEFTKALEHRVDRDLARGMAELHRYQEAA